MIQLGIDTENDKTIRENFKTDKTAGAVQSGFKRMFEG